MIPRFALFLCCFASVALGKVNYAEVRTKVAQVGAVCGDLWCWLPLWCVFFQAYAETAHELAGTISLLTSLSKESADVLDKIETHCGTS